MAAAVDVSPMAITTHAAPTVAAAGGPRPFVLVHMHPRLSLATDDLLLPPEQAPAFADALALAAALARLHDDETARVQAALAAARAQGLAEGLAQGRGEALQAGAQALAATTRRLGQQAAEEAQALEQQVVALALLVVRRIAADLAPEDVLAALARQAFEHLATRQASTAGTEASGPQAWQGCRLRLPPALLAAVQAHLGDMPGLRLVADEQLSALDCILDTPSGRLLAGLETQLARVQARLAQPDRHEGIEAR